MIDGKIYKYFHWNIAKIITYLSIAKKVVLVTGGAGFIG
jgi:hypothetical protein